MKVSLVLLFACISQLLAIHVNGQDAIIHLPSVNMSVGQFVNEVEKQTGYLVIYSNREVDTQRKIDLEASSGTVAQYLDKAFAGTNVRHVFENDYIILTLGAVLGKKVKQAIPVTGTVTDSEGATLPGVNVLVKGTTLGTVTNANGVYSITAPDEDATLVFSSMGYDTQEILVGSQRTINVTLSEGAREIEEVVVIGYGTVKKENLTGAVDQIRGSALENRATVTAAQALQGMVANLNFWTSATAGGAPGANPVVNLRGWTGFGKAEPPMLVIDGIQTPFENMEDINPNDIESISVLKDAASAAIYGSSAPYGVIIITTKQGRLNTAPKISYNNNFGWSQCISLPKMVNSLYFAETYNEIARNSGMPDFYTPEIIQDIKDYQAGILWDEVTGPVPGTDEWGSWWFANANNDWFDIYFKDFSFSQQHNVGVSGGTNNTTYFIGLGYNHKNGMYNFGDDSYKRFNVRANLSSQLTNWLTFNFRSAFSRGMSDTFQGSEAYLTSVIRRLPTTPLRNPDGAYSMMSYIDRIINGGRDQRTTDAINLTGEFVIKPLRGWDITVNYTLNDISDYFQNHNATVYYTNMSGTQKTPYPGSYPNSFLRETRNADTHVINAFTSYEKSLGGHYFKALAGYTMELWDYRKYAAYNEYLYSDATPSFSTAYGDSPSINDEASQLAIMGGFGRINYGYREKYLFEFNARYDGSSKFLKDARFKFYPGVSAAWVASKEEFWSPVNNIVNVFKIRASYGSLGDQSPFQRYQFYPAMKTISPTSPDNRWLFSEGRQSYASYPPIVNEQLTWITTTTFDVGFDVEVLKNRLSLVFDWYVRKADNFVGPPDPAPAILGAKAPETNNASIETRGVDLTLTWRDRIGDFGYGARAVLSDYQGTVISFPGNPEKMLSTWRTGQKIGELYGYETYGLFQTQDEVDNAPSQAKINGTPYTPGDVRYVDRDHDDKISLGDDTVYDPGDRFIMGNNTPRYSYGLTLDANYKGFDFSIFLQGVAKRDAHFAMNSTAFWGILDEWASNLFTVHQDRWTPDNPNGYFPKYYMKYGMREKNTQVQTRYMQNAAYMRIKNMQIGYSLPKTWTDKVNFDKVRLFLNVENLATFTKMISTIDPEFAGSGNGEVYPLQRTWSCGVQVNF